MTVFYGVTKYGDLKLEKDAAAVAAGAPDAGK
jgi:hypothetical protein